MLAIDRNFASGAAGCSVHQRAIKGHSLRPLTSDQESLYALMHHAGKEIARG
jgi:hypothetical protein